jgi:hypothetical protein
MIRTAWETLCFIVWQRLKHPRAAESSKLFDAMSIVIGLLINEDRKEMKKKSFLLRSYRKRPATIGQLADFHDRGTVG